MGDAIDAEGGIRRELELGGHPAELVRLESGGEDLLVARGADADGDAPAGERRVAVLVVLWPAHPELELDFVLRPVDRPVGHDEGLELVVFPVRVVEVPEMREPQKSQAPAGGSGRDQPLVVPGRLVRPQENLAVGVGAAGEIGVEDLVGAGVL